MSLWPTRDHDSNNISLWWSPFLIRKNNGHRMKISNSMGDKISPDHSTSNLYTAHISGNHQPSPYLRRFRLPSLNNSPTDSYNDLLSPISDQLPHFVQTQNVQSAHSSPALRQEVYRRSLEELEELKARRSRPASTSDYFSMTSSTCSDVEDSGDNCPAQKANLVSPTDDSESSLVSALKMISMERKAMEKRNEELMQENNNKRTPKKCNMFEGGSSTRTRKCTS